MDEVLKFLLNTLVSAAVGFAAAWFFSIRGVLKGLQMLLRAKLRQDYYYFMAHGLTFDQKKDYEDMYQAYHAMGKNGVLDNAYKQIMLIEPKAR